MQYQQVNQTPTAGFPFNYDAQMAQYQATVQATMHQYQATMHQSFQNYWTPNAFAYQSLAPAPTPYNPAPIHWHRPPVQSDAVVISPSNQPEKKSNRSEAAPKSPATSSAPINKKAKKKTDLAAIQQAQSSILQYRPTEQAELPTLVSTALSPLILFSTAKSA